MSNYECKDTEINLANWVVEDKMKGLPSNPLESLNNKFKSLESPC